MKLFFNYLRQKLGWIAAVVLFDLLILALLGLYQLPKSALLYTLLVLLIPEIAAGVVCYLKYRKTHKLLRPDVDFSLLQGRCSPIEEDYRNLITEERELHCRLQQASKQQTDDMMDYYSVWAHEIKTPIAAIRLLLDSDEPLSKREVSEQLQKIQQYVEMALCYLRLDSDSTDYIFQIYELNDILQTAIRGYASSFIRKGIRLEYEPISYKVVTDEKWLLFVVEQILSNSLKYTKSGSITVSMPQPDTLSIRDTGMGIAAEDLPRVFDKGYTGYHGRQDKKATGIGLYLSKRILTNLGHSISISSTLGEGTEVRIGLKRDTLEKQ